MCECWEMTMVICVKRKANIFISEELSLECFLTGDNTDVLSTFTDMTNMLNVFNPSTFYPSLKRALRCKFFSYFCRDRAGRTMLEPRASLLPSERISQIYPDCRLLTRKEIIRKPQPSYSVASSAWKHRRAWSHVRNTASLTPPRHYTVQYRRFCIFIKPCLAAEVIF